MLRINVLLSYRSCVTTYAQATAYAYLTCKDNLSGLLVSNERLSSVYDNIFLHIIDLVFMGVFLVIFLFYLKVDNHFVLPIANPFLLCPDV